ncbi:tRNA (N6-threonylcarbamoyladenosine(37)-N6)-methyltransferase TrmO [Halomonas rhizosphaerae]|uniref:tRNA (N6-threonylcarbamoyladenosine(37)-N6)-methyltransferase TrmO n=1 Tax=Halomonas rhizosphaerae TaxID=3043296 RepID=A0ABT6V009_9GAMM|nr:tRNA (N6-threonylcarbamoyladenosine(37)-N6)-methyltransferase TrmO [Halomonas rhizosphaerae]MDI5891567.1 tRNA (N6-threonylcarbamoyladenosine(37)-N6)-methyltransferase TrmO [Halomonas rhizosphaerae]MDI5919881.1 tRNA (N6-threonylcarbamoyladenosine(37)-N6)-methyltransferase TrmO [Halomonas rhizosphaerae]
MNERPAPPDALHLRPIGIIESDFPDKFGIPRQPGLAPAARASLVLTPPFDDPLAVRGLEAFSHLWLTFVFHLSPEETGPARWTPLVRPPRLGGNARVGVFASRSTHRPNRLGLSLVELVEIDTARGVRLRLRGADLVDGTPVLDIKPYLPWAESRPEARAGFAPEPPPTLAVSLSPEAEEVLVQRPDGDSLRELIRQVLAQDPRPAYRNGAEARVYGVRLRDVDVRFQARQEHAGPTTLRVVEIVPAEGRT